MNSEEKSGIKKGLPIKSKDYDFTAIGMKSSVLKTPEQILYERIELLEEKVENIDNNFKNLKKLLLDNLK
ncbi:hypothetical protein ABK046_52750, partial [Streptomyces caeruleatus]